MMLRERGYRRLRPLLGTFVEIRYDGFAAHGVDVSSAMGRAFAVAEFWQSAVGKFSYDSWVSRLRRLEAGDGLAVPVKIFELIELACELYADSEGAFDPYCGEDGELDLTGIAKGWIVDLMADCLRAECGAAARFCVNAGGDMRFIGEEEVRSVALRIGSGGFRTVEIRCDAVATSSLLSSHPSTVYSDRCRVGSEATVCVLAPSCAMADALTKIVMFAPAEVCARMLIRHQARALVFDGDGQLQSRAPYEAVLSV